MSGLSTVGWAKRMTTVKTKTGRITLSVEEGGRWKRIRSRQRSQGEVGQFAPKEMPEPSIAGTIPRDLSVLIHCEPKDCLLSRAWQQPRADAGCQASGHHCLHLRRIRGRVEGEAGAHRAVLFPITLPLGRAETQAAASKGPGIPLLGSHSLPFS